jgi:isopentenyl phosphate kinase
MNTDAHRLSYSNDDFPEKSGVFIVKLGGSVISDKNEYCAPNTRLIHDFGHVVRSRWSELRGRLIIVLGGGSYGSGVAHRYNLQDSSQPWQLLDLSIVTVKMFELLSMVTEIFREEEIPCFPFQASGYLISRDAYPLRFFIEPIKHALSMGLLPIVAGDLVFDEKQGFVIFSSDWIPELFVNTLPIKRVVMLTNVAGIMNYSSEEPRVVRRITNENYELVLNYTGPSQQQDVSGGMKNKLEALLKLSAMGVESVICDGRDPAILIPALFDRVPRGTVIESQIQPCLL